MKITVSTTKKDEVIDITEAIEKELPTSGVGACMIFVQHTTACITTADLDPGTDLDLLEALRGVLPHVEYRHPHNPSHTPDHILSSIIGPSLTVPYKEGMLELGTWQRVILIEFDGPRNRQVEIQIL